MVHDPMTRSASVSAELEEILQEGVALLAGLLCSEETLQKQLIQGDYRAISATAGERDELQRRLAAFETRREKFFPRGTKIGDGLVQTDTVLAPGGTGGRERLQALLGQFREALLQVYALQGINRELLRERLRFTREMQALLSGDKAYNDRGEPASAVQEDVARLDRNC